MTETTTVIFNDSCPICSREVASYQRYSEARDLPIHFAPIPAADLGRFGLTPEDAARRLHVVRAGKLLSGVDAFIVLWDEMPRFRWLARLLRLPGMRPLAGLVYERGLAPLLYAMHRRRQARAACG